MIQVTFSVKTKTKDFLCFMIMYIPIQKFNEVEQQFSRQTKITSKRKVTCFFSESTDVFVITSNRPTFFFPETENLNFGY